MYGPTDKQTDKIHLHHIYVGLAWAHPNYRENVQLSIYPTQHTVSSSIQKSITFQLLQVLSVVIAQEQYMATVSYHWHYRCFSTDSISLLKLPLLLYACLFLPLGIHVSEYSFIDNSDVV